MVTKGRKERRFTKKVLEGFYEVHFRIWPDSARERKRFVYVLDWHASECARRKRGGFRLGDGRRFNYRELADIVYLLKQVF